METSYEVSFEHPDHTADPPQIVENGKTAMQALGRVNELKAHGYVIRSIKRDGARLSQFELERSANAELVSR